MSLAQRVAQIETIRRSPIRKLSLGKKFKVRNIRSNQQREITGVARDRRQPNIYQSPLNFFAQESIVRLPAPTRVQRSK
jgi:hypothetical protein